MAEAPNSAKPARPAVVPLEALTPIEAATLLQLSRSVIYDLCESGELPCRRVGPRRGKILIDLADALAYWEACKAPPPRESGYRLKHFTLPPPPSPARRTGSR